MMNDLIFVRLYVLVCVSHLYFFNYFLNFYEYFYRFITIKSLDSSNLNKSIHLYGDSLYEHKDSHCFVIRYFCYEIFYFCIRFNVILI